MIRRLAVVASAAVPLWLMTSGIALAHGIGGRLDLPVPVSYFVVAAGTVIIISFLALAVLWPDPRLQGGPKSRPIGRVPKWVAGLFGSLGVIGLILIVGQVIPPMLGLDLLRGRPTVAPVLLWVVMWLVIPFASAFVGNWYALINPWRSLGRAAHVGRSESSGLLRRFGVWPATVALLGFTWFELISPESANPAAIGWAAVLYSIFVFGSMAILGAETGIVSSDLFTTYNRIFSAISPLGRKGDTMVWRGWLRALPVLPVWPGLAAFVVTAIGTVSYDGASQTVWFRRATQSIIQSRLGQTVLLVGSVAVIGGAYWLASWIAARMAGGTNASTVARRFTHTLVPIALAYAVAHYFTLILFEGQQLISAASDPFGLGWDIFGLAGRTVDFFITSPELTWYVQLGVIITGHVLGVVLAHDRALVDFGEDALRSQYAMLLLMVALTSLGLVILAG